MKRMMIKGQNIPKEEAVQRKPPMKEHYGFLDGIRAVAALYVLVGHMWLTVWSRDLPSKRVLFLTGWLQYNHFAVSLFIVISGFCLMLPVARGDGSLRGGVLLFFKKRARRILPPYYSALAVSLVLATTVLATKTGTLWDLSIPVTKMGLLTHLLLIHNVNRSYISLIDYPLWSIAVEWQIYFLFPALVLWWTRFGGLNTATLTVFISYLVLFLLRKTTLAGASLYYLGLFAMGMFGASVCFSEKRRNFIPRRSIPWGALFVVCFVLLVGLCCRRGIDVLHNHGGAADFLVGLCSMCALVTAFHSKDGLLRRFLSWKPLASIGLFSYSLYLIHAPLLQIFWQYVLSPMKFGETTSFTLLVVIGGPLIVSVAYLFFLACERPFLNWRPASPGNTESSDYAEAPS